VADRFTPDLVARISELTGEPAWLAERRRAAFERFTSLPWPDQQVEEWRHTDIRQLDTERFDPMPATGDPSRVELPSASTAVLQQDDGGRLIGDLDPAAAARGVVVESLARAATKHERLVQEWLGRAGVSDHDAKFEALAAAFWSGAAFVYVPRGVELELPIRLVRRITAAGRAVFPRTIVVADAGSSVTVIEGFRSPSLGGDAMSAGSVELYANDGAQLSYIAVQDWSHDVWSFGVNRALVGRDASVRTFTASLGARFSRCVQQSVLDGQGGHTEMLGLYFGDRDQHIDHRTLQLHRAPHTSSDLKFKGALKGSARAVYSGLVDIEKDGRHADAQQANRNLLLSEHASADPSPFLEIKTSEVVRATHGVSVGRPDEQVLFYLRSRGLDAQAAVNLYVTGFFQEIIDRIRVESVRELLERAVENELTLED
jgi:Fe-S cluster assembly protein SufD